MLRNQVNYHHLCLEDSKTGKRVGKVYGEKKKIETSDMLLLEIVEMEKLEAG